MDRVRFLIVRGGAAHFDEVSEVVCGFELLTKRASLGKALVLVGFADLVSEPRDNLQAIGVDAANFRLQDL